MGRRVVVGESGGGGEVVAGAATRLHRVPVASFMAAGLWHRQVQPAGRAGGIINAAALVCFKSSVPASSRSWRSQMWAGTPVRKGKGRKAYDHPMTPKRKLTSMELLQESIAQNCKKKNDKYGMTSIDLSMIPNVSIIRPLFFFAINQPSPLPIFLIFIQTGLAGGGKLFACQEALNIALHLLRVNAGLVAADRHTISVYEEFLRVSGWDRKIGK
jgi:hypothetical protein